MRCVTAHNIAETDALFGKHQPGGTRMLCRHECLQYARKPSEDPRGLGWWFSWPFFCNQTHVTRIVVEYRPCGSKVEGLKTVYQQHVQYIQSRGLPYNPVELFDHELCKQIKEWRARGKRILLMMDINGHPLHNKFYTKLTENNIKMEEFTYKCWGPKEPYTHYAGKSPIDGGYKTPQLKIVNLSMLTFEESPGVHRSFLLNVSTRLLLGLCKYMVCRLVSCRLVTSQARLVKRYNKILLKQFEIHRIKKCMDAVDKKTPYYRYSSPTWLRAMVFKLYKQMRKIRVHAKKNCRKILQPENDFSPTIQMWYNGIHAYLQFTRMKEGKTRNTGNI